MNAAPRMRYGILTLEISIVDEFPVIAPNIAKLTSNGPSVVPTLFTPPAKLNRCDPFRGSPMTIAKGFAAVCCNEKPSPTINSPEIIKGNEAVSAAG